MHGVVEARFTSHTRKRETERMNPARIEIPAFPRGKRIAVTTSFDDGTVHDRRTVRAFNDWGLKGTFNLNSGMLLRAGGAAPGGSWYLDASEVSDLFRGHEVAVHSVTHPFLERLSAPQIATEVLDDRKALEDLVGYPVRGMAYPYGTYSARVIDVLRALDIVYARTTENAERCFPPAEPLAWPSTAHMFAATPETVPQRFEKLHANSKAGGVFYIWGHSYEFERKNDWPALERIFKPLAGKADVWYCTNIALFDYEQARRRIAIAANRGSAYNPSAQSVTLSVDGKLVEVPGGQTVPLAAA
jgi:peptidoglycan-N-acetylglucosamine deacetylase